MNLRNRVAAASAIAIGAVAGAFTAGPAMAADSHCYPYHGTVCLADTAPNFGGQVWRQTTSQITSCRNLSAAGFNDKASMAFNNTFGDGVLVIYENANCGGRSISLGSQVGTQFRNQDAWMNNRASSVKFILV